MSAQFLKLRYRGWHSSILKAGKTHLQSIKFSHSEKLQGNTVLAKNVIDLASIRSYIHSYKIHYHHGYITEKIVKVLFLLTVREGRNTYLKYLPTRGEVNRKFCTPMDEG